MKEGTTAQSLLTSMLCLHLLSLSHNTCRHRRCSRVLDPASSFLRKVVHTCIQSSLGAGLQMKGTSTPPSLITHQHQKGEEAAGNLLAGNGRMTAEISKSELEWGRGRKLTIKVWG